MISKIKQIFDSIKQKYKYLITIMTPNRYVVFKSQKKRAEDCVVRALMKLTGKSWIECFDELCVIAREKMRMPNEWKTVEKWLKINGYEKFSYGKLYKGMHRETVSEFARKHNKGKFLLNLMGHVVACVDGYYYDSWDSGNCKILTYYEYKKRN